MDAIYFLYSAFSCLIVFGILCLIWEEHLMKIKAFLLFCVYFLFYVLQSLFHFAFDIVDCHTYIFLYEYEKPFE